MGLQWTAFVFKSSLACWVAGRGRWSEGLHVGWPWNITSVIRDGPRRRDFPAADFVPAFILLYLMSDMCVCAQAAIHEVMEMYRYVAHHSAS